MDPKTYGELGRSSIPVDLIEGVGSVDLIDDTCGILLCSSSGAHLSLAGARCDSNIP
jgi:hypothetical protein